MQWGSLTPNWQNLRDDLYAHGFRVIYTAGAVALTFGTIVLVALTISLGSSHHPTLFALGIVTTLVIFAFGLAMITHPYIIQNRHSIRYRYPIYLDITKNTAADISRWLFEHNITHCYIGSTNDARELGVAFSEFRVTRVEDMILVKMKF